jgi:hypothetical protein
MGGFISKPKLPAIYAEKKASTPKPSPTKPQPPKPTVVETTAAQAIEAPKLGETDEAIKTKRKGRRATILTNDTDLGGTSIAKKTLLG